MSKVMNELMEHFVHFTALQKENTEQAKEINDLKRKIEIYQSNSIVAKLEQENAELIEALAFYADSSNYGYDVMTRTDGKDFYDIVLCDFSRNLNDHHYAGMRARSALAKIKGGA